MNRTNKILSGMFLVAAVVSTGLFFKTAIQHSEYRAQVNNAVKDPGSTEFKNEHVSRGEVYPGEIYCAEVNSKNSHGGFVGFQRVMAKVGIDHSGERDGYVFFERDGLEGSGGAKAIIQASIMATTIWERVEAMQQERAGGDKATQSENEYRETAQRKEFEENWSQNCSLKASEVAPVVKQKK